MKRAGDLPHTLSRIFSTPLAIQRGKLDVILTALAPRLGIQAPLQALGPLDELAEEKPYEVKGGIAEIPIIGSLVQRGGMDAMSGMTSYGSIEANLNAALADPEVSGVLLEIDSNGGECAGLFGLAAKVKAASKPVFAVANEAAFSAAYALACAAKRLYVAPTGSVGSIGVVALHLDQSAYDQETGLKYSYVFSGEKKVDGNPHEPLSDRARADIQSDVDALYDVFVKTVSENRGISQQAVRATQAATYMAPDALKRGLVDRIGSLEDARRDLSAYVNKRRKDKMSLSKVAAKLSLAEDATEEQILAALEGSLAAKATAEANALALEAHAKEASGQIALLQVELDARKASLVEEEAKAKAFAAEVERQKIDRATAEVDAARQVGADAGVLMNDEDRTEIITSLTSADPKVSSLGRKLLSRYSESTAKAKTARTATVKPNTASAPRVDLDAEAGRVKSLVEAGVDPSDIHKDEHGRIDFERTQAAIQARKTAAKK